MNKLSEQVDKLMALQKQVKDTGIRAPCPTENGGQIIDFDAYMMSLSYPDLFEPEVKEDVKLECGTCPGCGGCTRS